MSVVTPFFAANWKMNKAVAEVAPFFQKLAVETKGAGKCAVVVAPPASHLSEAAKAIQGTGFALSGQNSGPAASGAFTGEIAPQVLKELGAGWTLIGHSERRHVFKEGDDLLGKRVAAALEAGLPIIFCVGETLEERRKGGTRAVVEQQLSLLAPLAGRLAGRVVIAYEPVWAIGTGENATPEQAEEVHTWIAAWGAKCFKDCPPILYGGSVKPDNAAALMSRRFVDGLLVGGASLEASSFAGIIRHGLSGWESKGKA